MNTQALIDTPRMMVADHCARFSISFTPNAGGGKA